MRQPDTTGRMLKRRTPSRGTCIQCARKSEYRLSIRLKAYGGHGPAVFFEWCSLHAGEVLERIGVEYDTNGYPMEKRDDW